MELRDQNMFSVHGNNGGYTKELTACDQYMMKEVRVDVDELMGEASLYNKNGQREKQKKLLKEADGIEPVHYL